MAERRIVVAGLGCRPHCTAGAVAALLYRAALTAPISHVAIPVFRGKEASVMQALARLGYEPLLISREALLAVQPECMTRSEAALHAVGLASVAEAAALAGAGAGARLILPRIAAEGVTCALAEAAAGMEWSGTELMEP